ncbi:hypothetical protein A1OE_851 [Candidatus Endolissoclinum faulkneri L2]|uniref:Uncharacterized protein n=1 Tax=Candidatus Endolissoclinum faulkneri L2 TaxID=1193729 RepID=K7ZCZ8_9PROT|nr:hypothetical protein A1OE_851 [Candidatus Endolissoclinum faulkneri L2]
MILPAKQICGRKSLIFVSLIVNSLISIKYPGHIPMSKHSYINSLDSTNAKILFNINNNYMQ